MSDTEWNAGNLGCGELLLELKTRLTSLRPDQIIKITAEDLGAREDLPAWCSLTGHTLIKADPPQYWVQRRKD